MLIRSASALNGERFDLRVEGGRVADMAPRLTARPGELRIEAEGGLLIPGLHDHHIHLRAFAASLESVQCGTDNVSDAAGMRSRLRSADQRLSPGTWIRAVGYHASIAGDIDREWLDQVVPGRPVRVQHRSGRQWIFNSAALRQLQVLDRTSAEDPVERDAGGYATGRLFDADHWLSERMPRVRHQDLSAASRCLAQWGVTGLTDATPRNDLSTWRDFARAQGAGQLLQALRLMGGDALHAAPDEGLIQRGARKFHLHEARLPEFDALCADIRASHAVSRECAFHCVTRTELAFVLSALEVTGSLAGRDRIEHAGITPPEWLEPLRALGLVVVSQPHFIAERGDAYRADVDPDDLPWLYRLRGLLDASVPLASGSDAPFGDANPWKSMQAAVERSTRSGHRLGADEALSPEQALGSWLAPLENPGAVPRTLSVGASADLCLLDRPWHRARGQLADVIPRMTIIRGRPVAGAAPADPTETIETEQDIAAVSCT